MMQRGELQAWVADVCTSVGATLVDGYRGAKKDSFIAEFSGGSKEHALALLGTQIALLEEHIRELDSSGEIHYMITAEIRRKVEVYRFAFAFRKTSLVRALAEERARIRDIMEQYDDEPLIPLRYRIYMSLWKRLDRPDVSNALSSFQFAGTGLVELISWSWYFCECFKLQGLPFSKEARERIVSEPDRIEAMLKASLRAVVARYSPDQTTSYEDPTDSRNHFQPLLRKKGLVVKSDIGRRRKRPRLAFAAPDQVNPPRGLTFAAEDAYRLESHSVPSELETRSQGGM